MGSSRSWECSDGEGKEVRRWIVFLTVDINAYQMAASVPWAHLQWYKVLRAEAVGSPVLAVLQLPKPSSLCLPDQPDQGMDLAGKEKKMLKHPAKSNMFFFPARITSPIWPAAQLHKQLCQRSGGGGQPGVRAVRAGVGSTTHERETPAWAPPGTGLLQGLLAAAVLASHPASGNLAVLFSSCTQRAARNEHPRCR